MSDVHEVKSPADEAAADRDLRRRYIHLQLLALGLDEALDPADWPDDRLARDLLANHRQKTRLLKDYRCPADAGIEDFLNSLCRQNGLPGDLRLPRTAFCLSAPGLSRELSLPMHRDTFENYWVKSYRINNGVLHNPRSDRRTTKGTFHVADIGLPVPGDKVAVPFPVFVELFRRAMNPPADLLRLPFTADNPQPAHLFCSLLLRPIVCPEIPGHRPAQTMEVRFFAPGGVVSNLDFVESIFGNAGDPVLPENDARLDAGHWTGHTGCVILAPHLINFTKAELGLPHYDQATPRQKRDGACWKTREEHYNDGQAFKVTCRSAAGTMVTIIADNYFGYCKKEVKTQISFAANLMGQCEEEHSGGAVAFPSYVEGLECQSKVAGPAAPSPQELAERYPKLLELRPEGHAIDRQFPQLILIPGDASMKLEPGTVQWQHQGQVRTIPLLPGQIYMNPGGQKFFLNRHPGSGRFRIVSTLAQGTFCHKPCTVSGGGKSEISKSLVDYMIYGPIYVSDIQRDLDQVEVIFQKDHSARWKSGHAPADYATRPSRSILDSRRSLGSVIKLLAASPEYTDEYNRWLQAIPSAILALVFLVKRLYRPEWGSDWRRHFSVDIVNGEPGHELKVDNRKAGGTYLRVGFLPDGGWRTFKVRQDFYPAAKIQMEDDITASVVVPTAEVRAYISASQAESVKLVVNCEERLFQRPDDAIHPGFDHQTEADFSQSDNFFSNYEPLTAHAARAIVDCIVAFDEFTPPMQALLQHAAEAVPAQNCVVACSAHPRLVDGKPSKNPRYLQLRPDLARPMERHMAELGARLANRMPLDAPIAFPVDGVLIGRRTNPPELEAKIRSLAVYNPIHYQELPEFFMDVICSLTGKSPSTTGAGSEGAMTKSPFNALFTTADLNAALIGFILTNLGGFSTAAGFVGPKVRVDHDISLLVPEIWCRLNPQERDAGFLIANGYLEKLSDFPHAGKVIPASRLGYRITYKFIRTYFGRIFDNPARVFDEAILRPETQDIESYVDGVLNIVEAQQRVAQQYFEDGSIEQACPPLRALLHIMAHGQYEGKDAHHADIRRLFTREYLLASDWYANRLQTFQTLETARWRRCVDYLKNLTDREADDTLARQLHLPRRLAEAKEQLAAVSTAAYLTGLTGTLGAERNGAT